MKIDKYKINKLPKTFQIFDDDILRNRDWYEKSWGGLLGPLFIVGYGCVEILNQRVKDTFLTSFCFVKNDKMSWFWDGRDLRKIRGRVLKIAADNPQKINHWFKQWENEWKIFLDVYRVYENTNIKKLTDKELYRAYQKIRDAYVIVNSLPYLADSFLSNEKDDWLVSMITEELKNKIKPNILPEMISKLTAATNNSFSKNEHIDLLNLAIKVKEEKPLIKFILKNDFKTSKKEIQKYPDIFSLLKNHTAKYYWVENSYFHANRLSEDYFLNKVIKILQNKSPLSRYDQNKLEPAQNKKVKDLIYKKYQVTQKLKKVIALSERFSHWQDTRKSCVFLANDFLFRFYKEASRRTGISLREIFYTIDPELKSIILNKGVDHQKLINRRKNGCLFVHSPAGWKLYEGNEYDMIDKKIFLEKSENIQEIRGVPASPGKIIGKVRIILKPSQLNKIELGDILVANNTTPDFVPAMKKAAAIITEQGGITTHAAVVSRELKVPCIIGTKIATQVLHDGDLVEVDADQGIVKIIK